MQPEHLAYWLERARAELAERDELIQSQRNEIERLSRGLQEVVYNSGMQSAIIAYEVQRFARERSSVAIVPSSSTQTSSASVPFNGGATSALSASATSPAPASAAVVKLSDLEAFLSRLTGGILETAAVAEAAAAAATVGGASDAAVHSPPEEISSGASPHEMAAAVAHQNDVAGAAVAASVASLRTTRQRLAFAKRCRDDTRDDGRPERPGQWYSHEQDVQ